MNIISSSDGWVVSPQSKDEREHLDFLFKALRTTYGTVVTVTVVEPAIPLEIACLDPHKTVAGE